MAGEFGDPRPAGRPLAATDPPHLLALGEVGAASDGGL